jgi:hypothetical protein
MVNPYVLIATHQRISITRKNIECVLKCGANVILVCSAESEVELFSHIFPKIVVSLHPNLPLGKKWQHGVDIARDIGADPLIINGSDDILSPAFFTKADAALADGNHFLGLQSWYVYDMRRVYRFNYLANLPLGGGRVYSKDLLKVINYSLFDISRDRHLDDLSYGNVLNAKMKMTVLNEPLILSVKGDWHMMNPVQKMFSSQNAKLMETITEPSALLAKFNY